MKLVEMNGVTIIILRNVLGEPSSNPVQVCFPFYTYALEKDTNPSLPPPQAMGK